MKKPAEVLKIFICLILSCPKNGKASVWRGWVNNFRLASILAKLKTIDELLRNRIPYCIWHDLKKPERKLKNLIRLGVTGPFLRMEQNHKKGMGGSWESHSDYYDHFVTPKKKGG